MTLTSFAHSHSQFWLLVLGYGVIGGFGLALAYIVPIAMLQKWFPDKRGLITGLAVGGFGFGAVVTSPVAQRLISSTPDVPTKVFQRWRDHGARWVRSPSWSRMSRISVGPP